MKVERIKCHHGNVMAERVSFDDGRLKSFKGGLTPCCFDELCTPAEGLGFIIVDRQGLPKRIFNGKSLVDGKKSP